MIALETKLNGKILTTAGAEDLGVLNAIVNAIGKLGEDSQQKRDDETEPDLFLSVGGLTCRASDPDEHLNWLQQKPLSIGDEILVKVVDVTSADPPSSSTTAKNIEEHCDKQRYQHAMDALVDLEDKYGSDFHQHLQDLIGKV